jgi:hypothetical protein
MNYTASSFDGSDFDKNVHVQSPNRYAYSVPSRTVKNRVARLWAAVTSVGVKI